LVICNLLTKKINATRYTLSTKNNQNIFSNIKYNLTLLMIDFLKKYLFFLKKTLFNIMVYMLRKTTFKYIKMPKDNQLDLLIKYKITGNLP
jgi:hypothetical protein